MQIRSGSPPVALTVAGSDCSSGAGLQADLKTFSAFGVYGLTVVTSIVSEVPGKVSRMQPATTAIVGDQLRLLLESFPVRAAKTGMLYSRDLVRAVVEAFAEVPLRRRPQLVVDPVMVATSGDRLLRTDAVRACQDRLFPLAAVITPNMAEAEVLLGAPVRTPGDLRGAADELYRRHGCAVVVKGGHLSGRVAVDVLRDAGGFHELSAPFVPGVRPHGTGCTFSAAIAAGLAGGLSLREAVDQAKEYVTAALQQAFRWGRGSSRMDALHHFAWRRDFPPGGRRDISR